MSNRRLQRIKLADRIYAQYRTPCLWCPELRPGQEPNMVDATLPGSHGVCKECADIIIKQIDEPTLK